MKQEELVYAMHNCADLFYQNKEQTAYEMLSKLLMPMNQQIQELTAVVSGKQEQDILKVIEEFLEAYQLKDNLALADILYYCIPEKMEEIRNGNFRDK